MDADSIFTDGWPWPGRDLATTLVLIAALVAALFTATSNAYWFWWATLAAPVSLLIAGQARLPGLSGLTPAIILLTVVMIGHHFLFSPLQSPKALYHALILLTAFGVAAGLSLHSLRAGFHALLILVAMLAAWGLLQSLFGVGVLVDMGGRANGPFYTPNTFAACINMVLLPVLFIYAMGARRVYLVLAVLLFAALLASGSRGGALSLLAGLMVGGLLCRRLRVVLLPGRLLTLFACLSLLTVFQLFWNPAHGPAQPSVLERLESTVTSGDPPRLQILETTAALLAEQPLAGYGAFSFPHLFALHRADALSGQQVGFVHNDYLQFWLELGLPGLLGLLILVFVASRLVYRQKANRNAAWLAAIAAGLAALFAHALVDFTLYPLPLVLLMGLYLGALQRLSRPAAGLRLPRRAILSARNQRRLAHCCAAAVLVWQVQPALAQVAAESGLQQLRQGQADRALTAYALARWFEPHGAEYYWAAGVVLRDQAIVANDTNVMQQAAQMFQAGADLHPWEIDNLQALVKLYSQHGRLLAPQAAAVHAWAEELHRRAPHDLEASLAWVQALLYLGEHAQARQALNVLVNRFPGALALQGLRELLQSGQVGPV